MVLLDKGTVSEQGKILNSHLLTFLMEVVLIGAGCRGFLAPEDIEAMSGGTFGCYTGGLVLLASRDTAQHPVMHRTASQHRII